VTERPVIPGVTERPVIPGVTEDPDIPGMNAIAFTYEVRVSDAFTR
jgi:hypothetical protein